MMHGQKNVKLQKRLFVTVEDLKLL